MDRGSGNRGWQKEVIERSTIAVSELFDRVARLVIREAPEIELFTAMFSTCAGIP